mmetsp:Transcript_45032/g.141055  ORF Transcript_45032/g.141055 Transcript_45032/m.141055 type:complete len:312 (+) Transcript_45032:122-1057(+)
MPALVPPPGGATSGAVSGCSGMAWMPCASTALIFAKRRRSTRSLSSHCKSPNSTFSVRFAGSALDVDSPMLASRSCSSCGGLMGGNCPRSATALRMDSLYSALALMAASLAAAFLWRRTSSIDSRKNCSVSVRCSRMVCASLRMCLSSLFLSLRSLRSARESSLCSSSSRTLRPFCCSRSSRAWRVMRSSSSWILAFSARSALTSFVRCVPCFAVSVSASFMSDTSRRSALHSASSRSLSASSSLVICCWNRSSSAMRRLSFTMRRVSASSPLCASSRASRRMCWCVSSISFWVRALSARNLRSWWSMSSA